MAVAEQKAFSGSAHLIDDQVGARREFNAANQAYGLYANAEEMILNHRLKLDPAVKQVSYLEEDEEASAAVDLTTAAEMYDLPVQPISAAVRGQRGKPRAVVFVIEQGRDTVKVVRPFDEDWKRPPLSRTEAAIRARAAQRDRLADETDALVLEASDRLSQVAATLEQETERQIADLMAAHERKMSALTARVEAQVASAEAAAPVAPEPVVEDAVIVPPKGEPVEEVVAWPRSHAALDALAEKAGVEFDESITTVADKIMVLDEQGVRPDA